MWILLTSLLFISGAGNVEDCFKFRIFGKLLRIRENLLEYLFSIGHHMHRV